LVSVALEWRVRRRVAELAVYAWHHHSISTSGCVRVVLGLELSESPDEVEETLHDVCIGTSCLFGSVSQISEQQVRPRIQSTPWKLKQLTAEQDIQARASLQLGAARRAATFGPVVGART
jgi:hypothetical protein